MYIYRINFNFTDDRGRDKRSARETEQSHKTRKRNSRKNERQRRERNDSKNYRVACWKNEPSETVVG